MKKALAALLLGISLPALATVSTEVFCFKSDGDKPVRFEMRTYYDDAVKWSGGMVRYANAKTALPLVIEHEEDEVLAEDRPHQYTTTWVELVGGRINGRYEMMSQGAMIYSMTYTSARTGKKTSFGRALDVDASEQTGCRW
ncbi:MAG: hypothetical protein IOC39_30855 [Burkholderia sp.]|jgi:hypothetical protein|nr:MULTISPECIES: hypothetical protein [Burkholderia]MBY8608563.1 hypothetical protein [Burkholderia arboris]MCA3780690.1 hypothetical protein [Burkholderia sp.]MCA3784477.1 hypothetical protein [Burkholderia sp.]MCA3791828.1 hypothetical protein [Burkholderia sp.]MCA3804329.1 hypothetical protein [Burkholderia sp.]